MDESWATGWLDFMDCGRNSTPIVFVMDKPKSNANNHVLALLAVNSIRG